MSHEIVHLILASGIKEISGSSMEINLSVQNAETGQSKLCRDGMRHEFRLGRNRSSRLTESPCKPHVHILPVERKTPDPFQDLQIATYS